MLFVYSVNGWPDSSKLMPRLLLCCWGSETKTIRPKTIGNRKRDCAWGCARGINTTWENLQIEKHKSLRWAERTPSWFVLFDLQIFSLVVFIPRAQPHAQSLFLFPIVFGIWFIFLMRRTVHPEIRLFVSVLVLRSPVTPFDRSKTTNANCFEERNVFGNGKCELNALQEKICHAWLRWRLAKTRFVHYFSLSISCLVFRLPFEVRFAGIVGKSYWKEPALSSDWRKFWSLCECIGYHYIWRNGQDQCLSADRSVESPGRWKWRASNFISVIFLLLFLVIFVVFLVRLFIICFLFVVSPDRVETDGRTRRRCLVLAGWDDSTTRLLMVRVRALEWSPLVLEML